MTVLQWEPKHVAELVRQMSPAEQWQTLKALPEGASRGEERAALAQVRLIEAAKQRGHDWLTMTEAQWETFVDDFLHEE